MINPEFEKGETLSEDETGYSEKQLDINAEIQAGEWHNLRKYRTFQRRSRQWKIYATYTAISNRITQLGNLFYKLVSSHPEQGEKLLSELRHLRILQGILLQCMVWEKKGELKEEMVPAEVWGYIN